MPINLLGLVSNRETDNEFAKAYAVAFQNWHDRQEQIAKMNEKPTTASSLDQAQEIILGDREETYGHPSKNLANIAGMWSIYLSAKLGVEIKLDGEDVSWLMNLMKTCRQAHKRKQDNIVDALGYLALIDRLEER